MSDPDRQIAEAFLARQLAGDTRPSDDEWAPDRELLARRHEAGQGEADFLDIWGGALDASEIVVATLSGLFELALERIGDRDLPNDDALAWMLAYGYTVNCLRTCDDVFHLLRRHAEQTAFAVFRVHLEMAAKTRLVCLDHALAGPFFVYATRGRWSNSATTHLALMGMTGSAKADARDAVDEARREAQRLTSENDMLRGDEGWSHAYLIDHNPRYRKLFQQGKRPDGPNLGDIERAADIEPQLRAIRAQSNAEVHGNLVLPAPRDEAPSNDIAVLLMTATASANLLALAVFGSFDPFGEDTPAIVKGLMEMITRASDATVGAAALYDASFED